MEVGLDRPERAARHGRNLVQRSLGKEAQRDDLAVWLVQACNGGPNGALLFATQGADLGLGRGSRPQVCHRPEAGRVFVPDTWLGPGDRAPAARLPDRQPDRDPRDPGAKRAVAPPRSERAIGDHEGLLGDVLGLGEVAEDPVAGADDGGRFALDQNAECVPITAEDGTHNGLVICD